MAVNALKPSLTAMGQDPIERLRGMTNATMVETDLLVIGGGTAGPLAAIKARQANPALRVLLLEKAQSSVAARSAWAWTGSTMR